MPLHVTPQKTLLHSLNHKRQSTSTTKQNKSTRQSPTKHRIQIARPVFENSPHDDDIQASRPKRKKWQLHDDNAHETIHEVPDDDPDDVDWNVLQKVDASHIERIRNTRKVPRRSVRDIQKQDVFDRYNEFRQNQHQLHDNMFVDAPVFEASAQMLQRKQQELMSGYNTNVQWNTDETADFTMRFEASEQQRPEMQRLHFDEEGHKRQQLHAQQVPQSQMQKAVHEMQAGAPHKSQRVFHVESMDQTQMITQENDINPQLKADSSQSRRDNTDKVKFPVRRHAAISRGTPNRKRKSTSKPKQRTTILKSYVPMHRRNTTTHRSGWDDTTHTPALFSAYAKSSIPDARTDTGHPISQNHRSKKNTSRRVVLRGNVPMRRRHRYGIT